ncbi:MAG: hypothetical protein WBF93_13180 [Pirellulales bacterium]
MLIDQLKQNPLTESSPGPPQQVVTFHLSARKVAQLLVVWVFVVAILGGFSHYVTFQIVPQLDEQLGRGVGNVMRRIGLEAEPSLVNWYSSIALLACAIALGIIAAAENKMRRPFLGWALLCVLFCFLALDEGIEIHELFSGPFRKWLGTSGALVWAWVLPYGLLALIVGLASLRFLVGLEPRTRKLFVLAGVMYCASAIGCEIIGGAIYSRSGFESTAYLVINTVEEFGEMLAIVIMLFAPLSYMGRYIGRVELSFNTAEDR